MGFIDIRRLERRTNLSALERGRAAAAAFHGLGQPDPRFWLLADEEIEWMGTAASRIDSGEAVETWETDQLLSLVERVAARQFTRPLEPEHLVGSVIGGRYRVEAVIGEGSSGVVYRARHLETESAVAIKLLHPSKVLGREIIDHLADPVAHWESLVGRFRREARAAASLQHPGIAAVFDFGAEGDAFYQALELLTGRSLKEVIAAEAPMDIPRALRLLAEAARAIDVAHVRGYVHRDLKPANIFLCRYPWGEAVKVIDFGIAKLVRDAGAEQSVMTDAGSFLGTVRYASPEQFMFDDVSPASDVYSLGVILFEMLAGRTPFEGSQSALSVKHTQWAAPSLETFRSDAPAELGRIVTRALSKNPAERPSRAGDLARMLDTVSGSDPLARAGDCSHAVRQSAARIDQVDIEPDNPSDLARRLVSEIVSTCGDVVKDVRAHGAGYGALQPEIEQAWSRASATFGAAGTAAFYGELVRRLGGEPGVLVSPKVSG